MVNKKGYMRIIEAVIAIVLVLIVIVAFLPKAERNDPAVPPEIEETSKAVLKKISNDGAFRAEILAITEDNAEKAKELEEFINKVIPQASQIAYALSICYKDTDSGATKCVYYSTLENGNLINLNVDEKEFSKDGLPKDSNIFIKTTTISGEDVTAPPTSTDPSPPDTSKTIKLYFWFKS